jgi:hypothetical protein
MSARNGDKARHEKQRKKRVHQRVKIRALVAAKKAAAPAAKG